MTVTRVELLVNIEVDRMAGREVLLPDAADIPSPGRSP